MITTQRALHLTNNKIVSDTTEDLKYNLYTQADVVVGKDIVLRLNIKNTAPNNRNVKIIIGGSVLTYNGIPIKNLQLRKAEELVYRQTGEWSTFLLKY